MTLLCSICIGGGGGGRREEGGEEGGGESEGSRAYSGGPYKGPGKTGEAIVRKSAMAQAPMHYLTQWDTDTLRVFAVSRCGVKSRTKRQRGRTATEQRYTGS